MTAQDKNNLRKYDDEEKYGVFPQGKLFHISFESVVNKMRLTAYSGQEMEWIIKAFSDLNPAQFYMKQYGYDVPKTISVINKFGYFLPGLVFSILKAIRTRYGSLGVVTMSDNCKAYINDYLTPLKKTVLEKGDFEISNISEDSGRNRNIISQGKTPYDFRDYQLKAVKNLIFKGFGRGMLSLPTSSGKSFVIANYCYNLHKNIDNTLKILLMVPNKQLVFQMYNDFKDYGMDMTQVTKFTAGLKKHEAFNPEAKIIIANRQYIFSNKDMLPKVDVLFCDEVHQVCAETTSDFIQSLDCRLKSGCSGSIPKNKLNRWKLIGMFGDVVASEDITTLQDMGYVSKLKITRFNIIDTVVERDRSYLFNLHPFRKYSPDADGYSDIPFNAAHDAEHEYYAEYYRDLYAPVLEYMNGLEENILILFDRIEVGQRLTEVAKKICSNKVIHYIDGSIDVKERLEITKKVEESGNNIIFAENACFSTGINIKRLTHISFFCSTKSFSRILQSVGRTLRLHKTKEMAHIIDVNHNFKYSRKHLAERLKIYREVYNKEPDEVITKMI